MKQTNTELHILVAELEKDLHKVARNNHHHTANHQQQQNMQATVLNLENNSDPSEFLTVNTTNISLENENTNGLLPTSASDETIK